MSETRGHFDEAFDVTDEDVAIATKPPEPWAKGTKGTAVVKEFRCSAEPGPSGFKYFTAVVEVTRQDGATRTMRDNSLSLSPAAKGKFVQFCYCFGLKLTSEINQVRRSELSPVGLTGQVVVGIEEGQDGNTYNRIGRYVVPKS